MSPTQLETAVQRVLIYAPDQYLMSPEAELGEIDWYKLLKIQSAVKDKSKTAANAKEKERIDFNKEALPHIASIAARREQYLIAQKKKDLESHQAIVTEKKTAANIIKRSTKARLFDRLFKAIVCEFIYRGSGLGNQMMKILMQRKRKRKEERHNPENKVRKRKNRQKGMRPRH